MENIQEKKLKLVKKKDRNKIYKTYKLVLRRYKTKTKK